MIETVFLFIVGFVIGVGIHRTMKERRDRKALRGEGLTLEKKLIAASVKLKAAERQNDEMRSYLGLNPIRREALVDDEPVVSKKTRAKKKASGSSPSVEDLKGLGPGSGSLPMIMLMVIGTAYLAEQQKKKDRAKKANDKLSGYDHLSARKRLDDIRARLQKKAEEVVDIMDDDSGFEG